MVRHWPVAASQHPFGHEAAVQTQLPWALQAWLGMQATHAPPPAPHAVAEGAVLHCPLLQQPVQLAPPQLQAPAVQACPIAHALQALPAEPHTLAVWVANSTQLLPWQQPPGQEAGVHSQTPLAPQACRAAQAAQAAPAAPHFAAVWVAYKTQAPVVASQQPLGHEVASQTHVVPLQRCPAAHAMQAAPPTPQAVLVGVVHAPVLLQQPVVHDPAPH